MANRWNYSPAHLDVFYIFKNAYNVPVDNYDLSVMDSITRRFAIGFLKIARERNVQEAEETWQGVIRDNPDLQYLDTLKRKHSVVR